MWVSYFETLEATTFEERDDGTTVFYPWGVFGKGHVLETPQQEERARTFVRRYNIANVVGAPFLVGLLFGIVDALVLKLLVLGGTLVLSITAYLAGVRHLVRGIASTGSSPSFRESLRWQTEAQSPAQLWALEALCLALLAVGVWVLADVSVWLGVLHMALFGLGAVMTGVQLAWKKQ